ncbi:MAG: SusD/RagB family nutrient-binding outer membrane lipoprotein [Bacteroidetes bacterium]|nr:MAG: SusD/RagB family nutrient-binding outer membrane lipoprotein [Bacteroidota bacterium]
MKKILILPVLVLLLSQSACNWFVDGYDVSPNDPTEATHALLLSASELATFTVYSGQLARMTNILSQHQAGTDFQFVDIANYVILEGDLNNEWNNIYSKCLVNENLLIEQAGDENPYYRGIAKVLKAMALGIATDLWGDVPNREAAQGLQGSDFYSPAYDAQEVIFADLQDLLSSAITDLSASPEANAILPGADDLIHEGDPVKWTKTAWILKARFAMRLSERDSEAASKALNFLSQASLVGPEDDANAIFGENGNEWNQWYAFRIQRGGYMQMGEFFVELLKDIDDPRLPFYATQTTDPDNPYRGTPLGSNDQTTSGIGTYFASQTAPAPMVTYVEALFIEAEAYFRAGNLESAATTFNEAVKTHVEQVTGEAIPATYEADQASETAATISLEKIMTHKYVASFTQIEAYTDWRRTGIPALSPNPGGQVSGIPLRLPTAGVERLYNTNAVVNADLLSPVWWDN